MTRKRGRKPLFNLWQSRASLEMQYMQMLSHKVSSQSGGKRGVKGGKGQCERLKDEILINYFQKYNQLTKFKT